MHVRMMLPYTPAVLFGAALLVSGHFYPGLSVAAAGNFRVFFSEMAAFMPFIFILIGLLDVWVPNSVIERHIGSGSGIRGTAMVILLAMLQAGPLYAAFPVAALLRKKGCSMRNVFIYLGAFSTVKLPMLLFETSFLGVKFSLLRSMFALPVFILIGYIMEAYALPGHTPAKQIESK